MNPKKNEVEIFGYAEGYAEEGSIEVSEIPEYYDDLSKRFLITGNKLYGECCGCGKIVRINKPIFGSVHLCI